MKKIIICLIITMLITSTVNATDAERFGNGSTEQKDKFSPPLNSESYIDISKMN